MNKNFLPSLIFAASILFSSSANSGTGTWVLKNSEENGGTLLIYQHKNSARFQLERYIGPPTYNSGFIEGQMLIHGQVAKYHSDEFQCDITFNFKKDEVVVTQGDGDCGFGMDVFADGTYVLITSEKPKFYKGDPRTNDSERE